MTAASAASVDLDVLVPTRDRPVELATTLAGLAAQAGPEAPRMRVVVSDQSDGTPGWDTPAVRTLTRWWRYRGTPVELHRHRPRRGIAEHRAALLERAHAPAVLFLDDDVWLEPGVVARLWQAWRELRCGMVGAAMQGLSFLDDRRPEERTSFEPWDGEVAPEQLVPEGPGWDRWRLHNAANTMHVAEDRGLDGPGTGGPPPPARRLPYRVAWCAGCVLFDRAALLEAGGFDFWARMPPEATGEDVVAQLRVAARHGAAGIVPSGAYHQEAPTTLTDRSVQAVDEVGVAP